MSFWHQIDVWILIGIGSSHKLSNIIFINLLLLLTAYYYSISIIWCQCFLNTIIHGPSLLKGGHVLDLQRAQPSVRAVHMVDRHWRGCTSMWWCEFWKNWKIIVRHPALTGGPTFNPTRLLHSMYNQQLMNSVCPNAAMEIISCKGNNYILRHAKKREIISSKTG